MKKLFILFTAVALSFSLSGCGSKDNVLVVWTFSEELKGMIEDHYLVDNPDLEYTIEVKVVPNDDYQTTIDPVLATGKEAPDVFALEAGYIRKYVEGDYLMDIADLEIESTTDNTLDYVLDAGTDLDGNLKALSWQATPGAFFYRTSLAEEYLDVTTPEEMQELVKDWDTFLETARTVNTESNGATKLVASPGELSNVFYANKANPWVMNNRLVIDSTMETYMNLAKTLQSEGLTNEANQWTDAWYAGMSTDDTMGYFLPTWGLHYVLKPNSATFTDDDQTIVDPNEPSTYGDWTMIQGPGSYFWGGTWLAARKGTEMVEESAHLIEYLTLNETFLTTWAEESGDVVSNTKVQNAVKDDFEHPLLNGQNHYAAFVEMSAGVDASNISGYDLNIQNALADQMALYAAGEKTLSEAWADFKAAVQTDYPDLIIN